MEKLEENHALLQSDNVCADTNDEKEFTVNECIDYLGFGLFQIKLSVQVGFSWMADAIAITLLATLAPTVQCYWNLSSEETALIATSLFTGMFFGSYFWGWLCDIWGRKLTISFSMAWIAISGIFSAVSPKYIWLIVAMVMQGFGVGGVVQTMTTFSEFLPTKHRAAGIIFINTFYILGNIITAVIAVLTMDPLGWRWYIIFAGIPIIIAIVASWWLPESPRFLVAAGQEEKAFKVLLKVAENNDKSMPKGHLKTVPCYLRKPRGRFCDLMNKENRRTTIILWVLWFTAIFSYYGIILCTALLLNRKGDSCGSQQLDPTNNIPVTLMRNDTRLFHKGCHKITNNDYFGYLLTTLGEIPGLFLNYFLAERFGRKTVMAVLFFVSVATISFLHLCLKRIALVMLIFLLRAFLTSIVQTVYLYTPEVYPTNIRAIGLGTASSMSRLGALLTPFVSQVLLETSPHLAIFTYSILLFICVGCSLILPKETKGRYLQESEED